MTTPTIDTKPGERVEVIVHHEYVPLHKRPAACQTWGPDPRRPGHYSAGCKCGACNGYVAAVTGTYLRTLFYADGSVEGVVELDEPARRTADRRYERIQFSAPNGDLCY